MSTLGLPRPDVAPETPRTTAQRGLTAQEFLAFTASRPKEERWELIEGEPVLNASPIDWHQVIVLTLGSLLLAEKARMNAAWVPLAGIGTCVQVLPPSLPQPDVMVLEHGLGAEPTAATSVALVVFEIISPSNRRTSEAWRRPAFASVPNLQHYVTISQRRVQVLRYDRAQDWTPVAFRSLKRALDLPALGPVALPLTDLYRWTPLGA
jgi:Uma2 family endonuclease